MALATACLILPSCSRYWDALVSNPCASDVTWSYYGPSVPPTAVEVRGIKVRHVIPARRTILVRDDVGVPSASWQGGLGEIQHESTFATFTMPPGTSEPVEVAIPSYACP